MIRPLVSGPNSRVLSGSIRRLSAFKVIFTDQMKIIIISEKNVPSIFPAQDDICITVRTIADLESHRDADLYMDLDFSAGERGGADYAGGVDNARMVNDAGGAGERGVADEARISALSALLPSPVIVDAVVPTLAQIGRPFIRINGWPGFLERDVHELAVPDEATAARITALYHQLGRTCRIVPDTPGMISARILASIISEAWYTWEEGVSSKAEIDTAMKLGTNYPMGPFEWSKRVGLSRICHLLEVLSREDARYRPANSLQQAVFELKCD
jgi:3-hydroxybutyryl-CoA dehydrogenase